MCRILFRVKDKASFLFCRVLGKKGKEPNSYRTGFCKFHFQSKMCLAVCVCMHVYACVRVHVYALL